MNQQLIHPLYRFSNFFKLKEELIMGKNIYIIEWFVEYEPDSEEENCHEVLDGCGYYDTFEEAMDCCRFLLEMDKEEILQDYPEATFNEIETDKENMLSMAVYDADADFKAVTYKVLEIRHLDET